MRIVRVVVIIQLLICTFHVESDAGERTIVSPVMDVRIEQGHNTVFCSTFQLAWNSMVNSIVLEKIFLEKDLDIVRSMNRMMYTSSDIEESDYYVASGFGSDNIARTINRELKEKFGLHPPVVDEKYNDDDVIMAYAFLDKELQYLHKFREYGSPMRFGYGETRPEVAGFGIGQGDSGLSVDQRSQVKILDYVDPGDFIIRIMSADEGEEIILACVNPGETLLETFEDVEWRIANGSPARMRDGDVLIVPILDVDIRHSYDQLLGLYLLNYDFKSYFVAEARQDIRFKLDNKGTSLDSQSLLVLKKGGISGKSLIFSKPFMIYLRKKGGHYPYFAIWVGNEDVMVPGT
ncbi:MAG: hypothetical protein KOO63_08400 [Bacteroidales bacterium]|nr:hypothetical protein [Candidatus Latescibacterota bacterium]